MPDLQCVLKDVFQYRMDTLGPGSTLGENKRRCVTLIAFEKQKGASFFWPRTNTTIQNQSRGPVSSFKVHFSRALYGIQANKLCQRGTAGYQWRMRHARSSMGIAVL